MIITRTRTSTASWRFPLAALSRFDLPSSEQRRDPHAVSLPGPGWAYSLIEQRDSSCHLGSWNNLVGADPGRWAVVRGYSPLQRYLIFAKKDGPVRGVTAMGRLPIDLPYLCSLQAGHRLARRPGEWNQALAYPPSPARRRHKRRRCLAFPGSPIAPQGEAGFHWVTG